MRVNDQIEKVEIIAIYNDKRYDIKRCLPFLWFHDFILDQVYERRCVHNCLRWLAIQMLQSIVKISEDKLYAGDFMIRLMIIRGVVSL